MRRISPNLSGEDGNSPIDRTYKGNNRAELPYVVRLAHDEHDNLLSQLSNDAFKAIERRERQGNVKTRLMPAHSNLGSSPNRATSEIDSSPPISPTRVV